MISLTPRRSLSAAGNATQARPAAAAAMNMSGRRVVSGPTWKIEIAVAPIAPQIIWPSSPRFQKRTRNASEAASPIMIIGAAWNSPAWRFCLSKNVCTTNSLRRSAGDTPASGSMAVEMTTRVRTAAARIAPCCCQEVRWRISSAKRRSGMIDHGAADRLPIGGLRQLGDDAPARHDAHPVGERQHFVEVLADEQHGGALRPRREPALVHLRARAHVEPAARAVRQHEAGPLPELAREHPVLRVAPRAPP